MVAQPRDAALNGAQSSSHLSLKLRAGGRIRRGTMNAVPDSALQQIFTDARSLNAWKPEPVSDELIRRVYDLAKLGPTATNSHPARFLFVKSPELKAQLREALNPGNVDKTMAAPVTVVVAWDEKFHTHMPTLFPARGEALKASFGDLPAERRDAMMLQNTGLEAASLIYAARALGLDAGPMGGFDKAKVDATLLKDTGWHAVLLINLGYGDRSQLPPRLPRLDFETAARIA